MAKRTVDQTRFHDPPRSRGNCTEAALATLLGVPLEAIGEFPHGEAYEFWRALDDTAKRFGFETVRFDGAMAFESLCLAMGPTVRESAKHMVVMQEGRLFHDPHPSRAGLTKVETCWLLVPFDPSSVSSRNVDKQRRRLLAEVCEWRAIDLANGVPEEAIKRAGIKHGLDYWDAFEFVQRKRQERATKLRALAARLRGEK